MFWSRKKDKSTPKTALILSGGGARAAYQVGVLKGLAEILPKEINNPFPILCGTSAGAINAAALAVYAQQYREAVWRLVHVWGNFHVHQVFRSDFLGLTCSALHWMSALILGGLGHASPVALLDRSPLRTLLQQTMPMELVQKSLDQGLLEVLSITASSYSSGESVSFFQSAAGQEPWQRSGRRGQHDTIGVQHLMASSAIPFVFAAEPLGDGYYGDGSVRQTAPMSSALHLGADKLLVIGVKHSGSVRQDKASDGPPGMGQIAGHVLDSIFLDNIEIDVERVQRVNRTFSQIPDKHLPSDSSLMRQVDILHITPSQDLYKIAEKHARLMPRAVRFYLSLMGVNRERGSNLLSYLLFEKAYCRELIALGYGDTLNRREEVAAFFGLDEEQVFWE